MTLLMDNQNLLVCKIDNKEYSSLEELNVQLRKFKIKQADYYTEYFGRKDLLTGEVIPFKSIDQYFSAYFVNKINMKKWYLLYPEEAKNLSIKILEERIKRKGLKKLPGEVELISCGLPSSKYYYNSIPDRVKEIGMGIPYDYSVSALDFNSSKLDIIVDTREQTPLNISGHNLISTKLEFGDYAIQNRENNLAIERKSLPDFIASFVSQYDRVRREFERAQQASAYLIVLVEESMNSALNYPHIPYFKKYTKIRPESVFHNVRTLMQDFDCQFIFCDGRVKSAQTLIKLFQLKQDVRKLDLQWCLDRSKLL